MLLLAAAPAHGDPGFLLTESEAGPGAVVHFAISDVEEDATFVLEIGDRQVARGTNEHGDAVSGQFTMPDLGDVSRAVSVEADITESEDSTTLTRSLRYAVPVPAQPGSPALPGSAPSAGGAQQTAQAAPHPAAPGTRRPARKRQSAQPPRRQARKPSGRAPHGAVLTQRRAHRRASAGRTRGKRTAPRTAPLFDGVPDAPPPAGSNRGGSGRVDELLSLNAMSPPTAALATRSAELGADGGWSAAVIVPLMLGLAALTLAGAVLLRRRRLATLAGTPTDPRLAALSRVARSGSRLRRGIGRRGNR